MNNSPLSIYYQLFITLNEKNRLKSNYINDQEILTMKQDKHKLSEFEMFKYIKAHDFLVESLGWKRYLLTEGINTPKNKYNNILVDLIYQNIPADIFNIYPLSIVFNIKWAGQEINNLTQSDLNKYKSTWEADDSFGQENYWYDEHQIYKQDHSNYAGNSYTYCTFCQLLKLLYDGVPLYKYNSKILTYNELIGHINSTIYNTDPQKIETVLEMVEKGRIKILNYQCIKVITPDNLNYSQIMDIKLLLIEKNIKLDYLELIDTKTEKSFGSLWDCDLAALNNDFKEAAGQ